jgi:hypothetical protein
MRHALVASPPPPALQSSSKCSPWFPPLLSTQSASNQHSTQQGKREREREKRAESRVKVRGEVDVLLEEDASLGEDLENDAQVETVLDSQRDGLIKEPRVHQLREHVERART